MELRRTVAARCRSRAGVTVGIGEDVREAACAAGHGRAGAYRLGARERSGGKPGESRQRQRAERKDTCSCSDPPHRWLSPLRVSVATWAMFESRPRRPSDSSEHSSRAQLHIGLDRTSLDAFRAVAPEAKAGETTRLLLRA